MSIKLMTTVWDMPDLGPGEKLVLLCLADQANDQGTHCWPSVETICRRSGQGQRTVRRILAELEEAGHITRQYRSGTSTQYRVHPCQNGTPAKMADLPKRQATPANLAGDPCQIGTLTTNEPSMNLNPPNPPAGGKVERAAIPDDWVLPAIEELPSEIRALAAQWPAGAYPAEGVAFHQYWRGRGQKRANWPALWAARVQAKHDAVMRAAKAGIVWGCSARSAAAERRDRPAVAAKTRETERSTELHAALVARLGEAVAAEWFGPVALVFSDCGLTVVAPTPFHAAHIEANHRGAIEAALGTIGVGVDWVRCVAERLVATKVAGGARRGK